MIPAFSKRLGFGLFTTALLLLAACQQVTPSAPSAHKISYGDKPPYKLDVAVVEVADEYQSPGKAPNIEHTLELSPSKAMHDWVNQRIVGTGKGSYMEVVIKDASIVEEKLDKTDGFKGFFTNDQAERYVGRVKVELKIYGERKGIPQAEIFVEANRARTVSENATLEQREQIQRQVVEDLMQEINSQLDNNIPTYFSKYIAM